MFVLEGPRHSGLTLCSNGNAALELGADRSERVSLTKIYTGCGFWRGKKCSFHNIGMSFPCILFTV